LSPREDFSPCISGQIGHCAAPCNLSVDEEPYNRQAARAINFLRGHSGSILGELARARSQAAAAMRFEEAARYHRNLEALATLAERTTRLSRVVTENNLVIVLSGRCEASLGGPNAGGSPESDINEPSVAYVILSGRLALIRQIVSPQAGSEVAQFVAENYELYKTRPIARAELEPMMIVAHWLKERSPTDGRIIPIDGAAFNPASLGN
jgi:hypothetical protein